MIPSFFSKPLSALLLFLFLLTPQSFGRNDRDRKSPEDPFASLLSDTVKDYFRNKEASQPSNKGGKTSSLSASKQNQNQKKLERLLEKSAREAERLIKNTRLTSIRKYRSSLWQFSGHINFSHRHCGRNRQCPHDGNTHQERGRP